MTEEVRVAIVGGGLMGREIAAALQRWPALVDHPVRPRLTTVCDVNPAALDWFDQIDTVTAKVGDYREVLADESVDVVYIAVRHDLHEQLYVDTVRAGKSLLAEKPFGLDLGAAERIAAAVEESGAFVRVSSEMPFYPGAQRAIDYVRSGALGTIVSVRSAFLHSSDLDRSKPVNWKRQARFCGPGGVMNDLGLHAWHVPLRLGWRPASVQAVLQNLVPERPGPDGAMVAADTWDNAVVHAVVDTPDGGFPLDVETKRIAPGHKNTWVLEAVGMAGGVRFSTATPASLEVFSTVDEPGIGREQGWRRVEPGSQSVWPTVTGGIFEAGFSDAILQMWAAFLAERGGALGDRFGCATVEEAVDHHRMIAAALAAHESHGRVAP